MRTALAALALCLLPSVALARTPQTQTLTLRPTADAKVQESSTGNKGLEDTLRVRRETGGRYRSYLRFDLRGTSGPVGSARLRLYCTDESPFGGFVYAIPDTGWTETGITWANQPGGTRYEIAPLGAVAASRWYEVDVTGFVRAGSTVVLVLVEGNSTNSAYYSSREGVHPPELVLSATSGGGGGGTPPVAEFSASPLSG